MFYLLVMMVVPCKKILQFFILRTSIQLLYFTVKALINCNEIFLWIFAVGGPIIFLIQVWYHLVSLLIYSTQLIRVIFKSQERFEKTESGMLV